MTSLGEGGSSAWSRDRDIMKSGSSSRAYKGISSYKSDLARGDDSKSS